MKLFRMLQFRLMLSVILGMALTETASGNVFASAIRFTQEGSEAPFDGTFTDGTGVEIRFVLSDHADSVQINIFTVANPIILVRTITGYNFTAGDTSIVWDGKNKSDAFVGPGGYRVAMSEYDKGHASYAEIYYDQPSIHTCGVTAITNPSLKKFGFLYSASNGGYVTGIARHSADGRQWGDAKGSAKLSNTGAAVGPLNLHYSSEADKEGYVYLIGLDNREVYRYHTDTLNVALIDSGGYGTTIQGIAIKGSGASRYLAVTGYEKVYGFPIGNSAGYFGPKDVLVDGGSTWIFWDAAWGRSPDDFLGEFTLFVTFYSVGDTARTGVAKFDLRGYNGTPLTIADTVWTATVAAGRANTMVLARGIDSFGSEDIIYFTLAQPAPAGTQGIYAVRRLNNPSQTVELVYADKQDDVSQFRSDITLDAAGNVIYFENSNEEVVVISPPSFYGNQFTANAPDTIRVLDSGTGVEGQGGLPAVFVLTQNFPNPFNPTTNIRYVLPTDAVASLRVYDVLGRDVATLVDERKSAGTYEVRFDATGLASGVYLYRLKAGDFVETRKLVLMR
jgi:hypothetical protein